MNELKLAKLIKIRNIETFGKGSLSFFEVGNDICFDVKRIYYIYQVPEGVTRGGHAHRNLEQLLICPHGSIEILLNNGEVFESVLLDNPSVGLIVRNMVWRDMVWRECDSVLMVAASNEFDEKDYVRDYKSFVKELDERNLQEMK